MRIGTILGAATVTAATVLGGISAGASAGEQLSAKQIAERTANGQFEFRSRTNLWRFAPDGRVAADYTASRLFLGGMSEHFGLKASGTWRRDGERLCIEWRQGAPAESGCYTVVTGNGSMVFLMGPQSIEGTLEAAQPAPATGLSVRPAPPPRPFGR